ncbi:MAG: methyltransferase domain-containing protein, partial [Acidobacteriota bacterium]|nr:methyltransferase domain-containing protein [Acidobacteriota bacterium]
RYKSWDQRLVQSRERRLTRRLFRTAGPAATAGLILDLPCGYGRFAPLLAGLGARPVNADLSLEMVKRAAEASGRPGVAADAKNGLPFRNGAFGAVFCMRLFHHIHDPAERRAVLEEFGRVSAGWAVVSYYRANALHKAQRAIRRLRKKSPRKIRMIEGAGFTGEAAAAGWTVVRDAALFRGLHAARITLLRKTGI